MPNTIGLPPSRPVGVRLELLDLQREYLEKEGVKNRGPNFTELMNAIRGMCFVKREPPLTELEVLELLGPPDYGISDNRGASFIYICGNAYFVDIAPEGFVQRVVSTPASAANLRGAPRWRPFHRQIGLSPGSSYLGVQIAAQRDRSAEPAGLLVEGITPGSPASRTGLKPGDVIVAFDDRPLESDAAVAFLRHIASLPPGQVVTVRVYTVSAKGRGSTESIKMSVGSWPPIVDDKSRVPMAKWLSQWGRPYRKRNIGRRAIFARRLEDREMWMLLDVFINVDTADPAISIQGFAIGWRCGAKILRRMIE
jgi:hypothetical protein